MGRDPGAHRWRIPALGGTSALVGNSGAGRSSALDTHTHRWNPGVLRCSSESRFSVKSRRVVGVLGDIPGATLSDYRLEFLTDSRIWFDCLSFPFPVCLSSLFVLFCCLLSIYAYIHLYVCLSVCVSVADQKKGKQKRTNSSTGG